MAVQEMIPAVEDTAVFLNLSSAQLHPTPTPLDPIPPQQPPTTKSAGHSLTSTYELLELILLSLPATSILLSQRVNKHFASVIATSPQLQQKLFFSRKKPKAATGDFRALLNPLLIRESVRVAVPLFFDHEAQRLSREWKLGRTRLVWNEVRATTVFVYLEFSDEILSSSEAVGGPEAIVRECESRTALLEPGSWERMFLAQPSCFFHWRVRLTDSNDEQRYFSGIVKGVKTMAGLLEGLEREVLMRR